ncbi:MAG: quinol:cytochrome C oxidoreductase [Flavobacteriaceae bacterium]|nr:quinol:cytochrome C oxidoreductase [Flavobacteriaceae bacterium]
MEHHHIEIKQERFEFAAKTKRKLFMLLGIGLLLVIIGAIGEESGMLTNRLWASVLLGAYYTFLLALGGAVFIGIAYLTNAGWNTGFKRVPEAMMQYMPIAGIILLIIFLTGHGNLYEWTENDAMEDPILEGKSTFLNTTFFIGSSVIFFLAYYFFIRRLRAFSLKEDLLEGNDKASAKIFHACRRISAGFIVVFGFTFPVIAWQWMMSLEPHWFSTIYSLYNFAIMWVCTATTIAMFCLWLKSKGYLNNMNENHFHDLGKFMFAFSIFWTYMWISQYLLIWYANIPEESEYFTSRGVGTAIHGGRFEFQFWLNLIVNFALPLLIFMSRSAKRNPRTMIVACAIILLGHWNDLYLMIMPGTVGQEAPVGFIEMGMTIVFFVPFIYTTLASLAKHNLIPVGHPYMEEFAHHEVAVA